jgi:hypothetical protein
MKKFLSKRYQFMGDKTSKEFVMPPNTMRDGK